MSNLPVGRAWEQIVVPTQQFQDRMHQMGQSTTGSLLSRLALIHQVAKAYALESLSPPASAMPDVSIEEITDPPFYESGLNDEAVVIQFSYQPL